MNYDRKALKLEAKSLIRKTRPKAWVVTLVFVLLAFALPELVTNLINPIWSLIPQLFEDMSAMILRGQEPNDLWVLTMFGRVVGGSMIVLFVSVLLSLFTMVMSYGYRGYALRVFRQQTTGVGDVFSGFPLAGRVMGTEIMSGIFAFLWMMLIEIIAGMVLSLSSYLLAGVLGLEWLAGAVNAVGTVAVLILSWLVSLRYCLAPFFVMSENMGVFEAINASKQTMKGHYGKKMVLDLSFLGWGALVVLILYIVVFAGTIVVMLTAGVPWLLELEEASRYLMTDVQEAAFILHSMADLARDIMAPMGAVLVLAWLAALPLNLWLRAYQTVADAGFFLTVTGQAILVSGEGEDLSAAPAGAEVIPAVPQPVWNETPEAQAETPQVQAQEPEAPGEEPQPRPEASETRSEAPQLPQEPEPPQPQEPELPAPPEPGEE